MHVVYRPSGDDSTEPDTGMPRVALYTSGHEPSSLDGQEAACRRYLATHQPQWRVVAVYRDAFDLLLVRQLDRLSRRMEHIGQIVAELDAASVAVRTVREPFDSAAPANRLILRLWAAFAEYERHVDLERRHEPRMAARHRRASAAKPAPSPAPPQPSETEAPAVPNTPTRRQLTASPAPEASMSRIIREIDRGTHTVDGIEVHITELVWADEGRSFEVHRTDTGADLTEDGCFDTWPTDDQITDLLRTAQDLWSCPGCGTTIDASQADLIVDHVRDCDRVDGAGHPVRDVR